MRALVRGLALRRLRLEPGRSALLVLGVALGVSVFVGVRALNATAIESIGKIDEVATGSAALVVEGGAAGVSLDLLPAVRGTPGVSGASPVIARFAREAESEHGGDAGGASTRRLLVLGLDLLDPLAKEASREAAGGLDVNPLLLATRSDAAIVAEGFAKRRGLAVGAKFQLFLAEGRRSFTVAGTFAPAGPVAVAAGGDVVVLPLPVAMKAFATPGRVDRIAVLLAKDANADTVIAAIRPRLGPGAEVKQPGKQELRSNALLGSMQLGLQIASLLALMIGVFLIYNAMSIAVVRRRPEIGILRAVGTTKLQLALLLFAEAAAFGVVGSALGIGLGSLLARAALSAVNAQVSQLYTALDARTVVLGPVTILIGLLAGPLATLVATAPPVWQALTVAPVEAARKDLPARDPKRAIAILALLGLALLGGALVVYLLSKDGLGLIGGTLLQALIGGGAALCAPWGVVLVTKRLRPLLARVLGPTGALAADNVLSRPGRAGVTVASLMVALGGVLAVAGLVSSLEVAIRVWVAQVIVADIYAAASSPLGSQTNTLLAPEVADELRAEPDVTACYPLRFVFEQTEAQKGSGLERSAPAMIISVDLEFLGEHAHVPVTEVIPAGLKAAVKVMTDGGDAVAVSQNFAKKRGLRVGDRFQIRTPTGPWQPEILVILQDYTSEHGTLYVDRNMHWRRWGDRRANAYDIFLRAGADRALVADRLRGRYGAKYDLFFTENAVFKQRVLGVVDSAFTVTYAMQIVAIGVALLGVVTTLYAAILERTREVGVLRAVGASRSHIARAVITEAFLLGAIASGFAVTTGAVLGYALVGRMIAGAYGWELAYSFPLGPAIFGVVAATLLAAFAGALPAARAAKISIVEALAYG